MYCLDTNIISFILKGREEVVEVFLQKNPSEISTTIINEMELFYGAYNSKKINYNLKQIEGFLTYSKIFNLDSDVIRIFAKEKTKLKKLGKTIENMDLLIASICLSNNLTLVTDNQKHFDFFKNLKVENWVKR